MEDFDAVAVGGRSPETSDVRPAFRRPSNDASHRKYRRHSPLASASSSSSSSAGGGFKRARSASPIASQNDMAKNDVVLKKMRKSNREATKDYDQTHDRRETDVNYTSEKHSHIRSSKDYPRDLQSRSEDYNHNSKYCNNDDRNYHRYRPHIGHDSRDGMRSEHSRREDYHEKLRRNERINIDKNHKEKVLDEGRKERKVYENHKEKIDRSRDDFSVKGDSNKSQDELIASKDRTKIRDQTKIVGRDVYKSTQKEREFNKEEKVHQAQKHDIRERERHRDKHVRDSERYSSDSKTFYLKEKDERKERERESFRDRERERNRDREKERLWYPDNDKREVRKEQQSDRGNEKYLKSAKEGKQGGNLDKEIHLNQSFSESGEHPAEKGQASSECRKLEIRGYENPSGSTTAEAEVSHDLNAAKLAAMKAAEIVNKNLGVAGMMSTDQKKKLLWGNKKTNRTEESGSSNIWDTARFADPERQEKFNKLMSLSASCYIWPFVGCQRRSEIRAKIWRRRQWAFCRREANGITVRFGEAIHSRIKAQRWPDCWIRFMSIIYSHRCNVFLWLCDRHNYGSVKTTVISSTLCNGSLAKHFQFLVSYLHYSLQDHNMYSVAPVESFI